MTTPSVSLPFSQRTHMNTLSNGPDHLLWQYDDQTLRIEPWGKNSLRVRAAKGQPIELEQAWALLPAEPVTPTFSRTENSLTISNGNVSATVDLQGRVTFTNQRGERLLEELWRQRDIAEPFWTVGNHNPKNISALKTEGREFKSLHGNSWQVSLRFEADETERLYGMGQYQQPNLDLKGCLLELAQRNSQATVPFALSSLGYGFLWNNPAVGEVAFARNETRWHARSTRQIDYWITAADTPADILGAYMQATGKPPQMPEHLLGLWQCKLRYRTQQELLGVAREYKRRGIDLSVIVIDYFHWTNQGDWRFDEREWPDVPAMVAELNSMGIRLMVSFWPTVESRTDNYRTMRERGYLVNTNRGIDISFDHLGNSKFFDATHPGAREYVWGQVKQNYFDQGIEIFWLDEAEPEYNMYDFENYRYHAGQVLEVGNLYPAMYSKAFYDGLAREGKTDIVNLVRCAWAGSQRYGALVWSGDIHSSFDSMRNQLSAGLNMAMSGIAWWTMDIGGFHGGNVNDPAFHELMVRWFQWAVFTPILRMHGFRDPVIDPPVAYRDGLAQCNTGSGNELWSFGEPVYQMLNASLQLRERLRPYVFELMQQAHTQGTPLMRPMFYAYPDQPAVWAHEDQYLFGPDVLVAPVYKAGQTQRTVYLPAGETWIDPYSDTAYDGGQTLQCDAPLARIPVFVRQGAAVLSRFAPVL